MDQAKKAKAVSRPRRNPVPEKAETNDFMTAAEARGEAAWMVMHALLRPIPRSMCKSAMAKCYAECDSLGIDAITDEVESLFWNIEFRDQAAN